MELFKLFGTIGLNGIDKFNSDVDSATGSGKSLADSIGKGIDVAAKIGTAAIAAAGTAVASLTKSSLENYAEYEQLVGGVETLFKGSADTVLGYANNAYMTAGMSANNYMSTITAFSASLLQGLGGDTAAAAKIADQAIIDMSDNANKMGTSMESVQDAYQGFAKQNYTMLDNLKLGYGGTATEMARLINDSGVLGSAVKISADQVNSVSFAKIIEAIHVVQDQLGITGTTAAEASSTIQGSISAMKSAWQNLVTGIADENADLKTLFDNFAESAGTAIGNVITRVRQIGEGISRLKEQVPVFGAIVSAVKAVAVAIGAAKIGSLISTIAASFATASMQVGLFALANGSAALANAGMVAQLTLGEVAVGVLTGKISLATAAQAAWNAVLNANPIGLVITAVAALTAGVVAFVRSQKQSIDDLVGTAETAEEVADKITEIKDRIAELEAQRPEFWSDVQQVELDNLYLALGELTNKYNELHDAEVAAAEEAATPAYRAAEATATFTESMTSLLDTYQQTYTQVYNSVKDWFKPFEEAKNTVTTSVTEMLAAMKSQMEFNNNYSTNLQKLGEYGLGSLSDYFKQSGKDGAAYAQAIVSAVEEAGGATSDGGQEIVQSFMEMAAGVEQSQAEVTGSLTNLSGEFDGAISGIVDSLAKGIAGLDKSTEAMTAAQDTFNSYLDGVNASVPGILEAMTSLGQQITAALQAGIGTVALPKLVSGVGGRKFEAVSLDGSFATGLDYVPKDGFIAELHKGEMVVPADEAEYLRNGGSVNGNNTEIVYVLGQILDAVQNSDRNVSLKINNREFGRLVKGVV